METVYTTGKSNERDEIIDFINYVFSQAHRPHDFKKLLPKVYGDGVDAFKCTHFIARSEKGIRACVSLLPFVMRVNGTDLKGGFLGNVSVHPYARSEGHMKKLVPMATEFAKNNGFDFLALGGQRQRYGYFGYDTAGIGMAYEFNTSNARHTVDDPGDIRLLPFAEGDAEYAYELYEKKGVRCLRDKDNFERILMTWDGRVRTVWADGKRAGYYAEGGGEIVLEDEKLLPRILSAILAIDGKDGITVECDMWDRERRDILYGICETSRAVPSEMVQILNMRKFLSAFLAVKASYVKLPDFDRSLSIGGEKLRFVCKNGKTDVVPCDCVDIEMTAHEAQRAFLGTESLERDGILPLGVLPLPFRMSPTDGF